MKKIFFIMLILLNWLKVDAYEAGSWTDEFINDPSVIVKDKELRYNWYTTKFIYSSDYYIEGDNDPLFPYIDKENYAITDFSNWQDTEPDEKPNRVIESKNTGRYRTLRPIRYLFLKNFKGGYLTFNISELDVLINNIEIKVNMSCDSCSLNFISDISDNSYANKAYINNGGSLTIDLGNYYGIEQIRLALYMYDAVPNTKKFDLYYNEGDTLNDRNYAYKEINSYVVSKNPTQPEKYLIIADKSFITNPVFNDWIYIDESFNATFYREMQFLNIYRYKDIKYRYYKEERSYLDGFYNEVNDSSYLKDEQTSKMFYLYTYAYNVSNNIKPVIKEPKKAAPNNFNDNKEATNIINEGIKNDKVEEMITLDESNKTIKEIITKNEDNRVNHNQKKIYICIIIGASILLLLIFEIRHQILSHQK